MVQYLHCCRVPTWREQRQLYHLVLKNWH